MKWDIFYDESDSPRYDNLDDWFEEIRHLVWPFIISVLIIFLTVYFLCFWRL